MTNQLDIGQVGDELTQALGELARLARDGVPGCDGASISVLHRGSVSTSAATQPRVVDIDRAQYRLGDGPCLTAIRNHQDIAVDDYESDGRWPGVAAEAVNLGIRSSLSLPMVDNRGTALGGLNMYGGSPSAFDEASQRSAAIFARHGTLILTQLRLLHN
jgi:GAF domain-containing protein